MKSVEVTPLGEGAINIPESHLNRNWEQRDAILSISVKWGVNDSGGIFRVEKIDLATLEALLKNNFVDPADQQNEAPTVAEIVAFMREYPGTMAFGYAVSPERPDYRVSIEGIMMPKEKVTPKASKAAKALCHDADEAVFRPDVFCWWD